MGYGSSTTTTTSKSKTAPLSGAGMSADDAMVDMFIYSMENYGNMEISTETKTQYADPDKASMYQNQIDFYNTELERINADLKENPPKSAAFAGKMGSTGGSADSRMRKKQEIEKKLFKAQDELVKIPKTTYDDYTFKEKEDIRITDAREKYGENSKEYKDMQKYVQQEKVDRVAGYADVEKNLLENLKIATSDEKLGAMTAKWFGPMKESINKMSSSLLKQVNETDTNLRTELSNINKAIDQTGLDFDSAISAAAVQLDQSNDNIMDVFTKALSSRENKFKFQLDYLNTEADKKAAQQAALYGYPPGSPQERAQAEKMKQDNLMSMQLQLAEEEAYGVADIQRETEAGKKQLSLAKVDFAINQGAKREDVARMGLGIAESTGVKKENILANKFTSILGIQDAERQARQSGFFGVAPTASGALAFNQNQNASNAALSGSLMQPINSIWGVEQQRTFAEAKNKSTQTSTPSIFSQIATGVGMGASAAVPVLTGFEVGGYGRS